MKILKLFFISHPPNLTPKPITSSLTEELDHLKAVTTSSSPTWRPGWAELKREIKGVNRAGVSFKFKLIRVAEFFEIQL